MVIVGLAFLTLLFSSQDAVPHGGVVAEEDLCIIEIGIFRAHFTIYQPETRASKEFCEDIPDVGNAVFVLDYLHDSLQEVPVDFRIIRDVTNRTIYANWADIQSISDLDAATEFYQPPKIFTNASLSVSYTFKEKGWYTGIVTTRHPTKDLKYQAVFGFHVGRRDLGFLPFIVLIIIGVQAHYWISSGGYRKWQDARKRNA
jgi:hypothetical protein